MVSWSGQSMVYCAVKRHFSPWLHIKTERSLISPGTGKLRQTSRSLCHASSSRRSSIDPSMQPFIKSVESKLQLLQQQRLQCSCSAMTTIGPFCLQSHPLQMTNHCYPRITHNRL